MVVMIPIEIFAKNVDLNIGKVGRRYAVYKWEDSTCTIFGIYRSIRAAKKIRNRMISKKKNDFDYLDRHREKDTRFIYRVNDYYRVSKSINGELKNFGHYNTLDEAISVRDQLIRNNWDDCFLSHILYFKLSLHLLFREILILKILCLQKRINIINCLFLFLINLELICH